MVSRRKVCLSAFFAFFIITLVVIIVVLSLEKPTPFLVGKPVEKRFRGWATALDEPQCSAVSQNIYEKGGTVADAAVASMLCLGVVLPESLGIGGGFLATYFRKSTGEVYFLDSRESAPAASTVDMFVNKKGSSVTGSLAVAVPGELRGYRKLLDMVGSNVTQKDLFSHAIKLARDGYVVGEHLATAMRAKRKLIQASQEMRSIYFNPATNSTWNRNDTIRNELLAKTLERLASSEDFVKEFYEGSIGQNIVKTLTESGGIMTMEDLKNYKVIERNASYSRMHDKYDVYSSNLPGSGPVLSLMINIIDAFDTTKLPENYLTYHRLVETMKFGYAKRTWLGDVKLENVTKLVEEMETFKYAEDIRGRIRDDETLPLEDYGGNFHPPRDHGTSHASFIAPNGDVIAITSTVNFYFGSGVQVDGIILNNEMDDFSTPNTTNGFGLPPAVNNFIEPDKRPMSSMAPTIILENKQVKLVLGGAGGSQITSAMAEVILHYFYQGYSLGTAIAHARVHHQYLPNHILYERECDPVVIKRLALLGHKTVERPQTVRGSVIVGIAREGDELVAAIDPRKGGGVIGGKL